MGIPYIETDDLLNEVIIKGTASELEALGHALIAKSKLTRNINIVLKGEGMSSQLIKIENVE